MQVIEGRRAVFMEKHEIVIVGGSTGGNKPPSVCGSIVGLEISRLFAWRKKQ
jgi:hypothetical protein